MPSFNTGYDAPDVVPQNSLLNLGQATTTALQNQTTQNALSDAQTARDSAVGIAAGDRNAIAQAAIADPVRAQTAISGLINSDVNTRQQGGYDLAASAALAGGVLGLPPAQRAAAYAAGRQQLLQQGHQNVGPEQYPGDDAAIAVRNIGLPALEQINHQSQYPSRTPADPMFTATGGPAPAGVAPAGNAPAKTEQGTFQDSLAQSESGGNPGLVNSEGYAGQYQYGTARLAGLGFYQPAQGEQGNQWQGQFTIPGFPQVKTLSDFLASPQAQNAVHSVDMANTDQAIASMPEAQGLSRTGLQAVAHLGGLTGMQRFVQSNGQYNPSDSNGTSLMDYYNKFSQQPQQLGENPYLRNGQPQQQGAVASGSTQQPQGSPAPAAMGAAVSTASASGGDQPTYANTGAAPPPGMPAPGSPTAGSPSGTQYASLTGTQGLPPTATDATAAPTSLPVSGGAPAGQVRNSLSGLGSQGIAAGAPNPLSALPMAQQDQGGAQPNGLAGIGATAAPSAPAAVSSSAGQPAAGGIQAPPGYHMTYVQGRPSGMVSDTTGLPYVAPVHKLENGVDVISNPYTGQVMGANRLFDTRAPMHVSDQTGVEHVFTQDGKEITQFGTPTYAPDMTNYKSDMKDVQEAGDNLQGNQAQAVKLMQQRQLLASGLSTGAGGNLRAQLAAYFDTLSPDGKAQDYVNQILTGSKDGATQAQIFNKLSLVNAGAQEKDNLGSRGGYQATKLYLAANPSMELQPNANRDINNLQLVANQANQDYEQGLQQWVNTKGEAFVSSGGRTRYQPSSQYDEQWQAQRNPLVYSAATAALNQKPFAEWSQGLKPDEIARTAAIVGRIDPNAIFMGPRGMVKAASGQPPSQQLPAQSGGVPVGATATGPNGAKIKFDGANWLHVQ